MAEVAEHGLSDRSLRDIAGSVDSSHRMLLYHFGSREGLVAAIVEEVESRQRELLVALSADATSAGELVMALWRQVSANEMLPFVRLFFECVAASGGKGLTDPWIEVAGPVSEAVGADFDPDEIRLGVAVTRGLLIDVLATGDVEAATRSVSKFIEMWQRPGVS